MSDSPAPLRTLLDPVTAAGPPVLLDGALGTELERRGVPSELPLWSATALLRAPEVVAEIHAEYCAAGADVLTANTFRTQGRTLARAGIREPLEAATDWTARAVRLARRSAAQGRPPRLVAGSAPPLEDCYRPDLVPGDTELAREHGDHTQNLAAAGVDLILVETMNTVREARAAATAAAATGLPFVVSFVARHGATLLSGESLGAGLEAAATAGALAVGVNCLPPSAVPVCLDVLGDTGLPFGVYANLGAPGDEGSERTEACTPREFAAHVRTWIAAGARIVGGCCGTRPVHIRAIADQLSTRTA